MKDDELKKDTFFEYTGQQGVKGDFHRLLLEGTKLGVIRERNARD